MHLDNEMDLRPTSGRTARIATSIYSAALFLSALLLFAIQPMFAKMVLHGSAAPRPCLRVVYGISVIYRHRGGNASIPVLAL